jgi:hypothetical protein
MRLLPHRRLNRVLGEPVERSLHGWRGLAIRAYVVETRGMSFDGRVSPDGLFPSPIGANTSWITIPLAGEYVSLRAPSGLLVRPSEAVIEDKMTWDERWEGDMRALVVEWSSTSIAPTRGTFRLGPADVAHARAIADAMVAGVAEDPWPRLRAFVDRLSALGVGVPPTRELELPEVPADVLRVEHAMSTLLSELPSAPRAVDLSIQTSLSERHLRRIFSEHAAWLGSFRARLRHARLPSAASWLALSSISPERIARSLGYGSARALMRALGDAGYGDRDTIRRRVT